MEPCKACHEWAWHSRSFALLAVANVGFRPSRYGTEQKVAGNRLRVADRQQGEIAMIHWRLMWRFAF